MATEEYEQLEWSEVAPIAREVFDQWLSDTPLRWAEHAWEVLGSKGLTHYISEIERSICLLRLLALNVLHREFSVRAFDEGSSGDWRYEPGEDLVGEYPRLDPFTLGQLAEREGIYADNAPGAIEDVYGEVVHGLVDQHYRSVMVALRSGCTEAGLFAGLWLSIDEDTRYPLSEQQVAYVANSNITGNKMIAWEWLYDEMRRAEPLNAEHL